MLEDSDSNNDGLIDVNEFKSAFLTAESYLELQDEYIKAFESIAAFDNDAASMSSFDIENAITLDSASGAEESEGASESGGRAGATGGGGDGIVPTSPVDSGVTSNIAPANITGNETSSELEASRSEALAQLSEAQAQKENNTEIQEAKQAAEDAKEAYDDAMEAFKENEAELYEQIEELNTQKEENDAAITEKKAAIENIKAGISEKETAKSTAEGELSSLTEPNKDDYAQEDGDGNVTYPGYEEALAAYEEEKQALEEEIAGIEDELTDLQGQLAAEEEALSGLDEKALEIDQQIYDAMQTEEMQNNEYAKAAQDALVAYWDAKDNVTAVEQQQAAQIDADIAQLRENISAYDAAIDAARKKEEAETAEKTEETADEKDLADNDIFSENSEFTTQYIENEGTMPYLLIGPKNVDSDEELPVIVYMHGAGSRGQGEYGVTRVGPGNIIPEWNLENFNGYIICPSLSGNYNAGSWNNEKVEGYLRNLLNDFKSDHNVNNNQIYVGGHSLGAMGTVYMAEHMDDVFSKAFVLSGYDSNNYDVSNVKIPIIGYVGSADDGNSKMYMNGKFSDSVGSENVVTVEGGHCAVPEKVLTMDKDGNNRADLFEWLFEDK